MRRAVSIAAFLAVSLIPWLSSAGETNHSWHVLAETLKAPRTVAVTLRSHTTIKGALLAIDEDAITLSHDGGSRRIAAGDVLRVRDAGRDRRRMASGILLGMAAGAAAAVAIDQASSHPSTKTEAATMGAIVIGLPAGAMAGRLSRGRPLYEAVTVSR